MTVVITHSYQSALSDDPTQEAAGAVTPGRWNAQHSITAVAARLLGTPLAGTGVKEILVGPGLIYDGDMLYQDPTREAILSWMAGLAQAERDLAILPRQYPYLSGNTNSATNVLTSDVVVATVSFYAVSPLARLSSNVQFTNATGASITVTAWVRITGRIVGFNAQNTVPSGALEALFPSAVAFDLQIGTQYTAELVVKQSGSTNGLSVTGEIIVENY